MGQAVLLGDPAFFRIRAGSNPHTRDAWGRRKWVDLSRAIAQWEGFKHLLESHGVKVHLLPPVEDQPGLVFPANAGFRFGRNFYLSNLHPGRAGEKEHYRRALSGLGLSTLELPGFFRFEGEADFFPLGHPSGDPDKRVYLFTCGRLERQRWVPRMGFPPYRRVYGFRSDRRALPVLQRIVDPLEVISLELADERHYHGDTVMCAFGPRRENLLVYPAGLAQRSWSLLKARLGERLLALGEEDARQFAANSFQITTEYFGERRDLLLMPDGLTRSLYEQVLRRGVIPCPVDVSEFLEKGGGAVKCMLLDLGAAA